MLPAKNPVAYGRAGHEPRDAMKNERVLHMLPPSAQKRETEKMQRVDLFLLALSPSATVRRVSVELKRKNL